MDKSKSALAQHIAEAARPCEQLRTSYYFWEA